jgi:hypothetical protein
MDNSGVSGRIQQASSLRGKTRLDCQVERGDQGSIAATLINTSTSGAAVLLDKRFASADGALEISFPLGAKFDDMKISVAANAVVRFIRE